MEIMRGEYNAYGQVQHFPERSQYVDNTTAPTSILEGGLSKISANPVMVRSQ